MATTTPALLIYSKTDYTKAPTTIELNEIPEEIVVFNEALIVCVQKQRNITFTKIKDGFPSINLRSTRQMRNLVCGQDFILYNDNDNQIHSWQINLGDQGAANF